MTKCYVISVKVTALFSSERVLNVVDGTRHFKTVQTANCLQEKYSNTVCVLFVRNTQRETGLLTAARE